MEPIDNLIPIVWKSSTADCYTEAAVRLRALGMSDDEIQTFLVGLYSACAADYGD